MSLSKHFLVATLAVQLCLFSALNPVQAGDLELVFSSGATAMIYGISDSQSITVSINEGSRILSHMISYQFLNNEIGLKSLQFSQTSNLDIIIIGSGKSFKRV